MSQAMTTGERIKQLLPATAFELLPQLDVMDIATVYRWIARLRKAKEIHVGSWTPGEHKYLPVYVLGAGFDEQYPTAPMPDTAGARLVNLLPATKRELMDKLGIESTSTMFKWLSKLRENEKIHIGRWERTLGDFAAVYVRGPGRDAQRPKRWTAAQLQRRYRKALKASGRYEDYLAKCRKWGSRSRHRKGQKPYRPESFDPLLKMFYRQL